MKQHNLHGSVLAVLFLAFFVMPEYHDGVFARIMVLAVYAVGYNLLFGYTGLLSLGHALFFATGMYGLALPMQHLDMGPVPAFLTGLAAAAMMSLAVGFLALRTTGVAFMIVTLMFAQAGFLTILYFGEYTRGDEGFVIQQADRMIAGLDFSDPTTRYFAAFCIFAAAFLFIAWLMRTSFGKCLVAIRENEDRARMLGYDVQLHKLLSITLSGVISGASGAAYAFLFGYAGATFASVQYSILPLLWVLLGGAGTTIGPLIGTAFAFYLVDFSSEITDAHLLVVGAAIVLLTLFAPQGLAGELRRRLFAWLP
ncbi:MAG: branched-chain amino acid ABC transporter permease [Rhodobacteraceae bacterium]|nr:branched-chain amino acid ABC transporter permease [Paracoccaceae bacterium]